MSGTNQYITMVAAISVVFQFTLMGELIWNYSLIFGGLTLVAAFVGIKGYPIGLPQGIQLPELLSKEDKNGHECCERIASSASNG